MGRAEMVLRDAPEGVRQVRAGRRSVRAAAAVRLGLWRMRPVWRLQLTVQVGMIAALLVVCAVPLFSQVALYTGLHGALGASPSAQQLEADIATNTPSSQLMGEVEEQVAHYVNTYLAGVDIRLQGVPTVSMSTPMLQFTQPSARTQGALAHMTGTGISRLRTGNEAPLGIANAASSAQPLSSLSGGGYGGIGLFAYPRDQLIPKIHLLDGHLPQARQDGIEILITAATASKLHLSSGSSLTLPVVPGTTARPLVLHIAGIFVSATPTSYPNFDPYTIANSGEVSYYAVTERDTIANSTYPWSSLALSMSPGQTDISSTPHWNISWNYELDVSRLTPDRVGMLLQAVQGSVSYAIPLPQSAGQAISINTSLYPALSQFQRRIQIAQLAVGVLLIAVVGLMLLFVTQMGSLLIERQEGLIAQLRSRGASRRQIFVTFATQSITMAVVALLVGPLLAVPLIRQVGLVLFPAQREFVMDALGGNPMALALGLWPVALVMTLIVAVTMLWAVKRAAALNILAVRQEAARSTRTPLWRKLYLDVLASLLALAGYGALALANSYTSSTSDTYSESSSTLKLISALGLVAPLFLMVAITLLFVRVFPLLLRLGEWLAARGRGAPAQLAFAHLARSARQSAQVIMLLALATGFVLMTVNALATSDRYATDAATFDAGADFSGTPANPSADFTQLAGVQSAAKGLITACTFVARGQQPSWNAPLGMTIGAVESERYAATVIWPDVNGAGAAAKLMGLLRQEAPTTELANTVPAIVDGTAHERVHATVGTILTLWMPGYDVQPVRFRVVAIVSHIPQMYAGSLPLGGSMLVDYTRYKQALVATNGATAATLPAPNYVWLRTTGDSASLHSLRAAFASGRYQLIDTTDIGTFYPISLTAHDRRTEIQEMHSDAFYVELIGTLAFGAVAALLLALLGTVVTLWIATRDRQVSFALLRALGSGRRRILRQVLWEHGVVCMVGLALGVLVGGLLTVTMAPPLPTLIFTLYIGGPIEVDGGLPVRIVWPVQTLGLTVGVLALVCVGTIVLAARAAARPALAAVLRLNED